MGRTFLGCWVLPWVLGPTARAPHLSLGLCSPCSEAADQERSDGPATKTEAFLSLLASSSGELLLEVPKIAEAHTHMRAHYHPSGRPTRCIETSAGLLRGEQLWPCREVSLWPKTMVSGARLSTMMIPVPRRRLSTILSQIQAHRQE